MSPQQVWSGGARFVTTHLIASTTSLFDTFGEQVRENFAKTYSITILATVLFDLLIKASGEDFTPEELTQHVETVIVEDLKLSSERIPEFSYPPYPAILHQLYRIMLEQVWPQLEDNRTRLMTARLSRVNYETLEIAFSRVETADGT